MNENRDEQAMRFYVSSTGKHHRPDCRYANYDDEQVFLFPDEYGGWENFSKQASCCYLPTREVTKRVWM